MAGEKDQWGDLIIKYNVYLYVRGGGGGDFLNICCTVPYTVAGHGKGIFFAEVQIGSTSSWPNAQIPREKVPYRDVALFRYDVKMQELEVVFQLTQYNSIGPLKLLYFDFNADPDPAFHSNADPELACKFLLSIFLWFLCVPHSTCVLLQYN